MRTDRRTIVGLVLCGWAVCTAAQVVARQAPARDASQVSAERLIPVGTATVVGQVVDAGTGRPVTAARVTLSGISAPGLDRLATPPASGLPPGSAMSPALLANNSVTRHAVTDAQGRFALKHLPAGKYQVNVNHQSYLPSAIGQRRAGGPAVPFDMQDGQQWETTIKMVRGGVVTGTAYGVDGEPMGNARVSVWRELYTSGVRRLQQQNSVVSDERGVYRLFGLQPGEYFVSAQAAAFFGDDRALEEMLVLDRAVAAGAVRPATSTQPATVSVPAPPRQNSPVSGPSGFLPTFFPSSPSHLGATRIVITGGDEHPGIDIQTLAIRASRVDGIVTNLPTGQRPQISITADGFGYSSGTGVGPDGRFSFIGLQPGTYHLVASLVPGQSGAPPPPPGTPLPPAGPVTPALFATTTVTVTDETPVTVSLMLQPGRSVSGRLVVDLDRPLDERTTQTVRLNRLQGQPNVNQPALVAPVAPDGSFTLAGVAPGKYSLQAFRPARSALWNGQDLLDFPLEVTTQTDITDIQVLVADVATELSGAVTPPAGYAATEFTVLVVPLDSRYWLPGGRRLPTTRADFGGRYVFRSLPPGTYAVGLVLDLEPGRQFDPEFLKTFLDTAGGVVTLTEAGRATLDLRGRVPDR